MVDAFRIPDEIVAFIDKLDPAIKDEALRRASQKRFLERMVPFFNAIAELVNTVAVIPPGLEMPDRVESYLKLHAHIKHLLKDTITLFEQESFNSALFLSIVAIEELGKAAVARIQTILGVPKSATIGGKRTSRSLHSHRDKHYLAAAAGAVINSRMDRQLGIERVLSFIHDAETGALEESRQSALYFELRETGQHVPTESVSRQMALEHLVIALELFAEIVLPGGDSWTETLAWVDEVEERLGFAPISPETE
jgi:AbiV family abortive infection protein